VCVPGPAGPVAPSIAGPKATPGGQAVSSNRTAAAPSVSNPTVFIQQHQASGREAGSGQLQDAARGDGSKAGGSAGRPGAASNDFQQVLDAAGRMRGRLTTLRSAATSVAGVRSTGAGNINLEESRSISELARVVRSNIGPRHSTMILRLDPPELGQLRIDVRMHDQMLTLRLEAHTPAGHEALQSRLSELRGALERQGIQLNQVEVELRPPSSPAMGTQDAGAHQESASEWDEPASRDSGAGSETGAGGGRPGSAGDADETTTFSGGGELPEEHRHGDMGRPAETGVDLVV